MLPPSSPLASLFAFEARDRVRCDISVVLWDFSGRSIKYGMNSFKVYQLTKELEVKRCAAERRVNATSLPIIGEAIRFSSTVLCNAIQVARIAASASFLMPLALRAWPKKLRF
jgi:hypothetical protein